MKMFFNAFVIAMQFMTRIPMPSLDTGDDDERRTALGYSMLFYPLVGLVIGFILFALAHFLIVLTSHPNAGLLVAAIVLLGWVALSGALHIDGLADSADAWLGGFGDKQRLFSDSESIDLKRSPQLNTSSHFSPGDEMIAQGIGFTRNFPKEWNTGCISD